MNRQLNKWENLFVEFLDMTEFSLQKRIDTDDVECYGVEDLQHANLGGIEQDFFYSASDILERMEVYEDDYIVKDILECMEEEGVAFEYNQWSDLLSYRSKLPHNQLGFDFIDMICHHSQDIDINNVYSSLKVA